MTLNIKQMAEYEAVKEAKKEAMKKKHEPLQWEKPIPFDEYTLPVFPAEVFPDWLRKYVEGVAESTQTPIDAPGMAAISILSTALAKKFYVRLTPEWNEPINTYAIFALPPGNRKSAVFKALQEPITAYEKEERERLEPEVSEQKARLRAKRKRMEQLEKEYAKNGEDATLQEIYALNNEIEEEEPLTLPRFITGDVTAEKLGVLMAENHEKMAVLSAEGGGVFSNMAGRYSNDGKANFDIYLNGHTGDYTPIDRIGREPILLQEPCLTIGLFVQPEVVRDVPPTFKERGLMQRFLYSFPRSLVGYRKISPEPIKPSVKNQYLLNVKKMMRIVVNEPVALTLDHQASQSEKQLRQEIENMFVEGGELSDMKEWGSKLAGQIIRVAGLLHMAEHIQPSPVDHPSVDSIPKQISGNTFMKARQLTHYFIEHAKAAYGLMEGNESDENAKYVLKHIKKANVSQVDRRKILMATKKRFKNTGAFDSVLNDLEDRGYIIQSKSGRKTVLLVNPHFINEETSHTSHSSEKSATQQEKQGGNMDTTLSHTSHTSSQKKSTVGNVGNRGNVVSTRQTLEPQGIQATVGTVGTDQADENEEDEVI